MTCRTSALNWLDVLYTSVRKTPGGVVDAAAFLADRRGKSMHPETLRAKLRGLEGESVTLEIAELLTEWMQEKAGGNDYALDWMQALAGQFGMAVATVPPPPEGGWADEIGAIQTKLLEITTRVGRLSGTAVEAMTDSHIDSDEAKLMVEEANSLITMALRTEIQASNVGFSTTRSSPSTMTVTGKLPVWTTNAAAVISRTCDRSSPPYTGFPWCSAISKSANAGSSVARVIHAVSASVQTQKCRRSTPFNWPGIAFAW